MARKFPNDNIALSTADNICKLALLRQRHEVKGREQNENVEDRNLCFWKPYGIENGIRGIANSNLKVAVIQGY